MSQTDRRAMRRIFHDIYTSRGWGPGESVSGPGSTRDQTSAFLEDLLALLRTLDVSVLLDAPCGDFNWAVALANEVPQYIGVDVVPALVRRHRRSHGGPGRTFLCRDIVTDALPAADLIFCRDALVHFPAAEIFRALGNLRRTGARYLLTTTFTGDRENHDIMMGDWRPLNLQRAPFSFGPPLALVNERCGQADGFWADKHLGLWRFADIPA